MFSPPPTFEFKVVKDRVGSRLSEIIDLTFKGRVQHVDQIELLLLPTTTLDPRQLLAFVIRLQDGELLVAETTLELFRAACRELSAPETH